MKKKLLIGFGILVGLVVLTVVAVMIAIDPIVRTGVEKLSTAALKVPTRLGSATVKYAGSVTLDNLEVANPPGYKEPRAMAFEKFVAAVDPGSLLSDTIKIQEVSIVKPDLTIEFIGSKSNWSTLMDNLALDPAKKEEPAQKSDKKFMIQKVRVESAKVRFRSDLIPTGTTTLTLPTIEIHDIGTADGGASASQVLGTILQALASEATKAGQGKLPGQILGQLQSEIGVAAKTFRGALDTFTRPIQDVPGKILDEPVKKIKDLFEKKK